MNRKPSPASRKLRDAVNDAGVRDQSQSGALVEVSLTQADKHSDAAGAYLAGRIDAAELTARTGWVVSA